MADLFHTKRDSLETFIKEQMIGPNGCRGWYTYASEDFDDKEEVLNTTPGSIYSTAILFPKKKEPKDKDNNTIVESQVESQEDQEDTDEENEMTRTDEIEQSGSDSTDFDDDDICSINRRFPNIMGLSCCLRDDVNLNEDVKITVSGRYYTKIRGVDKQKVQVRILQYVDKFKDFWDENLGLHQYFTYSHSGKLLSINNIAKDVANVKQQLKSINKSYAEKIAIKNDILNQVEEQNRYLRSYREHIFNKKLSRLKDKEYISDEEKSNNISIIEEIEVYETIISFFEDLIGLYDKNSFGFWLSHTFSKEVSLSDIPFDSSYKTKKVYNPDDYACLKNVIYIPTTSNNKQNSDKSEEKFLSLSLWLQVTHNSKDTNDKHIYLKTSLENTSSPFVESDRNYFSIVTEGVNEYCFFGTKIEIESKKIEPYRENHLYNDVNNEDDNLNFLYKDISDYAVGHFCSVDWEINGKNRKVYTEFLPSYETPDIEPVPRNKYGNYIVENGVLVPEPYPIADDCLQFKWLSTFSDNDDETIRSALTRFVNTYEKWIEQMRGLVKDSEDATFANANLEACTDDCNRMKANINGILYQPGNMKTFRMMNSVMYMQMWHSVEKNQESLIANNIKKTDESFYKNASDEIFFKGQHVAWRPFQLAFILLNLDGIIRHPNDHNWQHRNEVVDLVWFPTGGGKTEAYLGLIALCIIHRRRNYGSKGFGVTAIMRYTLRLLTTQQFQRALRLILALEEMRIWDIGNLGEEPISIGLYVGANSLPNSLKSKKNRYGHLIEKGLDDEAIEWHNRDEDKNKTRIPLDRCPWCGARLDYDTGNYGFLCQNKNCTFNYKHYIPIKLCDEQIYSDPPTLLIGTVDKFAAIAHKVSTSDKKSDSRRIFGKGIGPSYLPPDLIIQDELHLLLGPLGSAVSLFECAIDQLCSREENIEGKQVLIRPKIISSTATTRNTKLQIRALYDRDVNIFPKNGITYDDSFFSFYKRKKHEDAVEYVSKRKYIGIMPTGRTQMTTQMRLAAILLVHRAIFEENYMREPDFEKAANNYYSVISYFNSLRELGKTDAQFYTEYSKYIKRLYRRVMHFGNLLECFYAMGEPKKAELSGRLSGSEVNECFAEVGRSWTRNERLPHKNNSANEEWKRGITPPDYILATNMISVGLDVDRFNTIIINSMPRNIAEYIQATSRVARNTSGLVLTLHNPFRVRDISHFERFREFHEKLYYYVEPISITPFSLKSIEKYLPLYMAAVIRHSFEDLSNNRAASNITKDGLIKKIKEEKIFPYFQKKYNRIKDVEDKLQQGLLTEELYQYLKGMVDNALEQWEKLASDEKTEIVYDKYDENHHALFTSPEDYEETKNLSLWSVPRSLRIVEPEAVLHIGISNANNKK